MVITRTCWAQILGSNELLRLITPVPIPLQASRLSVNEAKQLVNALTPHKTQPPFQCHIAHRPSPCTLKVRERVSFVDILKPAHERSAAITCPLSQNSIRRSRLNASPGPGESQAKLPIGAWSGPFYRKRTTHNTTAVASILSAHLMGIYKLQLFQRPPLPLHSPHI